MANFNGDMNSNLNTTLNGNMNGNRRNNGLSNGNNGYAMATTYAQQPASQASTLRVAPYMPSGNNVIQHGQHEAASMAALAQGFGQMSIVNPYAASRSQGSQIAAPTNDFTVNGYTSQPNVYVPQHSMVYLPNTGTNPTPSNLYTAVPTHLQPMAAPAYAGSTDNSPHGPSWATRVTSDAAGPGMPSLMAPRRGSISSNEEHNPATPYSLQGGYNNAVTVIDRSPHGVYAPGSSPSPLQFLHSNMYMTPVHKFNASAVTTPMHIKMMVAQDPPIPRAIPAPSSPMKPLDRCLENKTGETNVYIRGLLPETTDDMLHIWGARFGDIQSSKSIIDLKTGLCKGFGFIKYHNFDDAEECIRGFHFLGYEVSFARESFYAKLKKFSDECNTNLYVSNIPRNMNEHELSQCFLPYRVMSSRILRDDGGNGRGVGFARFESRDVCEDIIKNFNNTPITKNNGEEHIIQIRYSDTHEQKMLKQQTAAARQFRAAEFEFGCLQTGRSAPGLLSFPDRLSSTSPVPTPNPPTVESADAFTQYLHRSTAPYVPPGMSGQHKKPLGARTAPPAVPSDIVVKQPVPVVTLPDDSDSKNEGGVSLDKVDKVEAKPRSSSAMSKTSSHAANDDDDANVDRK